MATPHDIVVKTAEQVRDDYLRVLQNGLFLAGIDNANVGEGTYDYARATAEGLLAEEVGNLVQQKANALMPDTALGADLERVCRPFGLTLRPAGPSVGFAVLTASLSPVLVPEGSQLLDKNSKSYKVRLAGSYNSGDSVPIIAVDTGTATNLPTGSTLRWVSPPPFVATNATVASPGLSGGVDQEEFEGLRERLYDYYRNPPGGSNWAAINASAEKASSLVSKAFSYPAVYGNSTIHVACTGSVTATDRDRSIPADILETIVKPGVYGDHAQYADIVVTGVFATPVDVVLGVSLPASKAASPPGPGGGWIDGSPWPRKAIPAACAVKAVTNAAAYIVEAAVPPSVGNSICYVSPLTFEFYRAKILSFSEVVANTTYAITTDTPFYSNVGTQQIIQAGQWIFPDAENMDVYVATILAQFSRMGPAEKTSIPGLLPNAYRKPAKETSYPDQVGGPLLRALVQSGDEVLDASFLTTPDIVPINAGYKLPLRSLADPQPTAA